MLHSFLFTCLFMFPGDNTGSFFEKADAFFSEYVVEGKVDYQEIKKNGRKLDELVREIAELDLSNKRVTPEFLKAFYINAYNILVIKQVVGRYPIESPMDIEGFFNGITHEVMGDEMTLDELEKEILYEQFPDAKLHFVLVCAAKGCPPLASYSYQPDKLEKQLMERTGKVMNLDWFIRVKENRVEISPIFSWYREDFVNSAKSVREFINLYRNKKIEENKEISFYEYDWSLNEK